MEILKEYHSVIKALHIISVMAWMAGMLYLPRLFVYHCQVEVGSPTSELFKVMERRLLRLIINPAMISSFVFGIMLIMIIGMDVGMWLHIKLFLAFFVLGSAHGLMAHCRKKFERDENTYSETFYRVLNEVPTLMMIFIVLLAVVRPF